MDTTWTTRYENSDATSLPFDGVSSPGGGWAVSP